MTTIKITGSVQCRLPEDWETGNADGLVVSLFVSTSAISSQWSVVGPCVFEYEAPADWSRDRAIESLRNQATDDLVRRLERLRAPVQAAYFGEFKPGANLDVVAGEKE